MKIIADKRTSTRTITTVPNQIIVTILPYKEAPSGSEPYGIITRRAERVAARLLNDRTASHILYYHFALNQDGYEFALSPKAIFNSLGLSEKQYYKAIGKLKAAGFLVQSKSGSNLWYFTRLPKEYAAANEMSTISGEVPSPDSTDYSFPEGQTVPPQRDRPSPPNGIERMPSEGGRNNIDIIDNTNILLDSSSTEDKANNFPTEKQSDNYSAEEETVNSLLEESYKEFGHLDDWEYEVSRIEENILRRHNLRPGQEGYSQKYIAVLKWVIEKFRGERTKRRNIFNNEYRWWIDKANYKMSSSQHTMFNFIKCAIKQEQPFFPNGNGLWVEGWNEKGKRPNILRAFYWLPKELLEKRHNDVEDVPEEYYSEKKEDEK